MTIDPFVLLTPVLLLAVFALVRFVGCNWIFGLDETVLYEPPTITDISPTFASVCGPAFTLTVSGTRFDMGSVVQWNGASRDTTFSSDTELEATITADDIAELDPGQTPKFVNVTVKDSFGGISQPRDFVVDPGAPVVVVFERPQGVANRDPVNVFQNINFPGWMWLRNAPNESAIYFDDPMATERTFTFVNGPRILQRIHVRYLNPGSPVPPTIAITVTDDKGESTALSISVGEFKDLDTGWVKCSQMVTVTLDNPSDNIGIVQLTYLGPG